MTYLLDTNVCIELLNARDSQTAKRLGSVSPRDISAAETYGQLRLALEKQGNLIGPYDLLIASIALANNVTLVTHNTNEFKRVPDLKFEDWWTESSIP